MAALNAVLNPGKAYRKIQQRGFGRTSIYFVGKVLPRTVGYHVIPLIRTAKVAADIGGYFRRRSLAHKIKKTSRYADFFPEEKAFRIAPPGTFEAIDRVVPVCQTLYEKFLQIHPDGHANNTPYSYIMCDYVTGKADGAATIDMSRYPEIQDAALSRPLVEMAVSYIGEVPIIGCLSLQVVMPNDATEGFQKFHIDRVDKRQLKIFVAISDVDEGNGATMILPADVTQQLVEKTQHYYGLLPDEVVKSPPWVRHLQHAAGPRGSAIFFDTCRLIHAGARTRRKPRVILEIQYVSKYCYAECPSQLGKLLFDKSRARDEIDRLVMGA